MVFLRCLVRKEITFQEAVVQRHLSPLKEGSFYIYEYLGSHEINGVGEANNRRQPAGEVGEGALIFTAILESAPLDAEGKLSSNMINIWN